MGPYFFTFSAFNQQDNTILYLLESPSQAEENSKGHFYSGYFIQKLWATTFDYGNQEKQLTSKT